MYGSKSSCATARGWSNSPWSRWSSAVLDLEGFRFVVVGAGFYGAVIAHRIATELGEPVLVLDRRHHIGGNCHSEVNGLTNVEVHTYGTHIFHTSDRVVWDFVRRFAEFTNYRHRVFARHGEAVYTMPINLMTISRLYGRWLSPDQARALIAAEAAAAGGEPANFEEKARSLIGGRLYEAFIRGYTAKQWGTDPKLLPAGIITRLPVRFNYSDFYFADLYEGMPVDGYHALFRRMLDHPKIRVALGVDFQPAMTRGRDVLTVYSGPIDQWFEHKRGHLGWRTLEFEHEVLHTGDHQGCSVLNWVDEDVPHTRVHEYRHLHPEREARHAPDRTIVSREYSRAARIGDEPYYPVATPDDLGMLAQYMDLAKAEANVLFGGRLGTYRYMDMHHVIASALGAFDRVVAPWARDGEPIAGHVDRPQV
ncbi:MAG: UDP-galactopyranose mutase [Alphaproteobacteria bacterium]|nr:UDP-galactopyranose mutase [Alphaproteobacteria bacterium]